MTDYSDLTDDQLEQQRRQCNEIGNEHWDMALKMYNTSHDLFMELRIREAERASQPIKPRPTLKIVR